MKSMRARPVRLVTDESPETRQIATSLPWLVYERLDDLAEFIGAPMAVIVRRAVCKYLQEMEEKRAGA